MKFPHLLTLALPFFLSACVTTQAVRNRQLATGPASAPPASAPANPATGSRSAVPVAAANVPEIRLAELKVAEARQFRAGGPEAEQLLNDARRAAAQGDTAEAQRLAQQARSRAELALDGYYVMTSSQELQKLYAVTGLNDSQLARMREAEVALVRGEAARAYALLQTLNKEITAGGKHKVRSGESLWSISALPDIYANGYLWPLIWDANRDTLKDPGKVRAGQLLRIKRNPTVEEVVKAVEYARAHVGRKIHIGEIKEEKQ